MGDQRAELYQLYSKYSFYCSSKFANLLQKKMKNNSLSKPLQRFLTNDDITIISNNSLLTNILCLFPRLIDGITAICKQTISEINDKAYHKLSENALI